MLPNQTQANLTLHNQAQGSFRPKFHVLQHQATGPGTPIRPPPPAHFQERPPPPQVAHGSSTEPTPENSPGPVTPAPAVS